MATYNSTTTRASRKRLRTKRRTKKKPSVGKRTAPAATPKKPKKVGAERTRAETPARPTSARAKKLEADRKREERNARARERRAEAKAEREVAEAKAERARRKRNRLARERRAEAKAEREAAEAEAQEAARKKAARRASAARKRAAAAKREKRTRAEVEALREAQRATKGEGKKSPARKKTKRLREGVEKARTKRELVTAELPRAEPKQRKESEDAVWEAMRGSFRELLKAAVATGQAPVPRKRLPKKVDSSTNIGDQRRVSVRRVLEEEVIEDVLYKVDQAVRTMPGDRRIWYISASFSGLGERLFGSSPTLLKLPGHPHARNFQAEGFDNTGLWNSYVGARDALSKMLDDYARSPRSIIYLHHLRIMNFDRKAGR